MQAENLGTARPRLQALETSSENTLSCVLKIGLVF
jgi:hypothetical protein